MAERMRFTLKVLLPEKNMVFTATFDSPHLRKVIPMDPVDQLFPNSFAPEKYYALTTVVDSVTGYDTIPQLEPNELILPIHGTFYIKVSTVDDVEDPKTITPLHEFNLEETIDYDSVAVLDLDGYEEEKKSVWPLVLAVGGIVGGVVIASKRK